MLWQHNWDVSTFLTLTCTKNRIHIFTLKTNFNLASSHFQLIYLPFLSLSLSLLLTLSPPKIFTSTGTFRKVSSETKTRTRNLNKCLDCSFSFCLFCHDFFSSKHPLKQKSRQTNYQFYHFFPSFCYFLCFVMTPCLHRFLVNKLPLFRLIVFWLLFMFY